MPSRITVWLTRHHWWLRGTTLLIIVLAGYLSMTSPSLRRIAIKPFNPSYQSLMMMADHTLVWTSRQYTQVYDPHSFEVQYTLTHANLLASSSDIGTQLTAISADGQWFAVATRPLASDGSTHAAGNVEVWSLVDQQRVAQITISLADQPHSFQQVLISRDSYHIGWIVSSDHASSAEVWDRTTQNMLITRTYHDQGIGMMVTSLIVDTAEPLIMLSNNAVLEARRLRDDTLLYHLNLGENDRAGAFCALNGDGTLQACEGIGLLTVRRVADGQLVQRFPTRYHDVFQGNDTWDTTVAFSPDSRFLLTASSLTRSRPGLFIGTPDWSRSATEPALLWDLQTGQVVQRFDVTPDGAVMVAYSPDGQYVAAYGKNGDQGEIRIFRVQPQLPFLQPLCVLLGLVLGLLLFWQWLWARGLPKDGA